MSESDHDSILLTIEHGVATVTLNRPAKLNAFAGDMRERLVSALDRVAGDSGARVLVITGAGKGFCSGGDVAHMVALKREQAPFEALAPLLESGRDVITRLAALPIPTIAAVNGVAAGAGCNLALACDLRLASDAARFGETFVRIGLHLDWGGAHHLPRLIGLGRALEVAWTGRLVDAEEAHRLGLVERLWPAAEFDREWRAFARRLAEAPATSVRAAKRTLRAASARTLSQTLAAEVAAQAACWASADSREGLAAFAEKREPRLGAPPLAVDEDAPSAASRQFE